MTRADKQLMTTVYVPKEGRASLDACMTATFDHCRTHGVKVIVIYTATGEGACIAVERFTAKPEYSDIQVVAVTPPVQKTYASDPRNLEAGFVRTGIVGERRLQLHRAGVPIVSARLPFRPVFAGESSADPAQFVDRAFGILGGGFSFCIQASLAACDAGAVAPGQRIAAMSADTAVIVIASHTEAFTSAIQGLLVEHIVCRPLLYDISKPNHVATQRAVAAESEAAAARNALLEGGGEQKPDAEVQANAENQTPTIMGGNEPDETGSVPVGPHDKGKRQRPSGSRKPKR